MLQTGRSGLNNCPALLHPKNCSPWRADWF